MAISPGYKFGSTETVTSDKLRQLVANATISLQKADIISDGVFDAARIPTTAAEKITTVNPARLVGTFDGTGEVQPHPDQLEVVSYTPSGEAARQALQLKDNGVLAGKMHEEALDADDAKRPVTTDSIRNASITDPKNAWGVNTSLSLDGDGRATVDGSVSSVFFIDCDAAPTITIDSDKTPAGKPILIALHNNTVGDITPEVYFGSGGAIQWSANNAPMVMHTGYVFVVSVVKYTSEVILGDWVMYPPIPA